MITPYICLTANQSDQPLEIRAHVNHGNGKPFDVVHVNGVTLFLRREQTREIHAKLAELIAMPETPGGSQ